MSAAARRPWPAVAAAQHRALPRLRFDIVDDDGRPREVGSVARAHRDALARWPRALRLADDRVTLAVAPAERQAFFAEANAALHADGLIRAWRDETYPVLTQDDGTLLATFERAASRFWGTVTFGAHCNGYVAGADGRPERLWLARRALTKPTDPGKLDNLIGGGVPYGQSPGEAVLREGWEEAGLRPEQMQGLQPGRILRLARDIPEGFQLESISVYDLALPPALLPQNQDGEVGELMCLPIGAALDQAAGDAMTVDAALVTLDFALRHHLLPGAEQAALEDAMTALWLGPAQR